MHKESRESRASGGPRLERAIVLQLLRDDVEPSWSREGLLTELGGAMPALEEALIQLQGDGLLAVAGERVSASRAARRLDELGLIGI